MYAELLRRASAAAVLALSAAACVPVYPRSAPAPALPPLPVEQIARDPEIVVDPEGLDPLAAYPPGETVTLSARNVDVRALLPALAEAADLSLVMGPEVQGRVTVNLVDVPALEALRQVLDAAGLMIASEPLTAPWDPVVFYAIPVNIQTADRLLIRARYGVSAEMADWIVQSRIR